MILFILCLRINVNNLPTSMLMHKQQHGDLTICHTDIQTNIYQIRVNKSKQIT